MHLGLENLALKLLNIPAFSVRLRVLSIVRSKTFALLLHSRCSLFTTWRYLSCTKTQSKDYVCFYLQTSVAVSIHLTFRHGVSYRNSLETEVVLICLTIYIPLFHWSLRNYKHRVFVMYCREDTPAWPSNSHCIHQQWKWSATANTAASRSGIDVYPEGPIQLQVRSRSQTAEDVKLVVRNTIDTHPQI